MEGCPRSSMLTIDLKESIPVEFTDSLKKYITDHYQEDPENYKHECQQLEQLRSACLHPSHDHSGCSMLRRYFAQLQYLQSRFPMVDSGAVSIQFTWIDLYSEESIALADARYEQAAILHNLGALHSLLGSQEDRTGEEGMKVACTHFQAAAGVFQYLKNTVMVPLSSMKLPWVSEDHFAVPFFDLASCVLQLYINILLGQAQECLLEKSILDGRKDSLVARISMQVYDYYQQALGILESLGSSYLGSKKSKVWTKAVKIKACHFTCVSYIHMSNHAHENQKFGEKVAYLKAALQKLTEAQKQSKGQPERTLELLQFMADVVNQKLEGAEKDNDFIYHEVVPDLASLPVIKGASLVKPIPFQPCDPSVTGPDIFQRLIPMEAHTDASIYSEEKAKLLRRYNASIEVKNKQLAQSLASLHIDDLLQPVVADTLPPLLKEKHENLSKDNRLLSQAEENIQESSKLSDDIDSTLRAVSFILDEDEEKEGLAQVSQQEVPQERGEIRKECEKCKEALSKANHTNNELVRVYNAHRQNLELIAGSEDQLLAALPSLNIIDSPVDDGAVQRLRDLIAKVEEMKVQRKTLEENLRIKLNEDDVTGLLVTRDGNKMAFFDEQLKKHDTACSLIQANLDAQDKIISALTEANAKYAKTRQAVKENTQRREEVVQALILSYNTFCELQGKLSRGVDFYQRLSATVKKLEDKCKNFFDNHSKELDKLIEKKKTASESAKPPSRPSAAKPDHLVKPQAPISDTFISGQQPGSLFANIPQGGIPLHDELGKPISTFPRQPVIPTRPPAMPHSVPHIPADQAIHTTPRMSYPFPESQRSMRLPEPGRPPRQIRPGQINPSQGVPRFQYQNQVPPSQQPTSINASQVRPGQVLSQQPDILSGQQNLPGQPPTIRPQLPAQQHSVRPQQPDVISQMRPSFPPFFQPGQQMPFTTRPESPQSPMGQPSFARHQSPSNAPVATSPLPVRSMPQPRMSLANHPPQLQPRTSVPSTAQQHIFPGQSGQQHHRPELQSPQPHQSVQPPNFQPRTPFNQPFPGQPLQPGHIHQNPPNQGSQPQFRPENPSQQSFRPELLSQQQFRPQQQPQQPAKGPLQPQQPLQQQFRPQSFQPALRPQHSIPQQFLPNQQQQFRPQQPRPPHLQSQSPQPIFRPQQQQLRQQFRPEQQPQQFEHQQPFQRTSLPQQPSQQHFVPRQPPPQQMRPQSPQQMLRPQQPMQQQVKPEQPRPQQSFQHPPLSTPSFQQTMNAPRPDQQLPQPLLPEQLSKQQERSVINQPQRPEQSSQAPFRPEQTSQQPYRSEQTTQQTLQPHPISQKPFRPDEHSQQSLRQDLAPNQPFRPISTSQHPSWPNQSTQLPFKTDNQQPPERPGQQGQPQLQLPYSFCLDSSGNNIPERSQFYQGTEQRTSQVTKQPTSSNNPDGHGVDVSHSQDYFYRGQLTNDGNSNPSTSSNRNIPQSCSEQNLTPHAQSYPETGAFLANQSSNYGGRPTPSLLSQGSRPFPNTVTSSDYLTSFSVALAQTQLSQYQNSSSQQQMQQFQQQLLLQQQQLILQQQEMLRQQQSQHHPHDSEQTQIGLLLQQILQQQKQLSELEMKVKDKSEHQLQHKVEELESTPDKSMADGERELREQRNIENKDSTHNANGFFVPLNKQGTDEGSQKELKPVPSQPQEKHEIFGGPNNDSNSSSTISEQQNNVFKVDSKPSSCTFVPDYAAAGKWFSDVQFDPINSEIKNQDSPSNIESNTCPDTSNFESNLDHKEKDKNDAEETDDTEKASISEPEQIVHEAETVESEKENECDQIKDELDNNDEETELEKGGDEKEQDEEVGGREGKENCEEESINNRENEEARRLKIDQQINEIKELQNLPLVTPAPGNFYEPGQPLAPSINEPGPRTIEEEDNKPSLIRQHGHYYASQISSIDQATNNSCLNDDEAIQALVSAVKGFDLVVKSLSLEKHGTNSNGFDIEWRELNRLQEYDSAAMTVHAATMNQPKNRYRDILPWDHTRVKLSSKEESDYINANFIKSLTPLSPSFIATQGPIATTLTDFWLMVWEQQSHIIVMLTREVEGNKLMCHQYWPIDEGHTVLFGPIRVSLKTLVTSPLLVKRVMHVQHSDSQDTLVVTHLQFCGWPDKGVPQSPTDLLSFVSEARSSYEQSLTETKDGPIIVHCSAGIGRAGTFIVLYAAIREFNAHREFVNIPRIVRNLRLHRKYMVQKKEQYEFCYKTLLFYAKQFLNLELSSMSQQRRASLNLGHLDQVSVPSSINDTQPKDDKLSDVELTNDALSLGESAISNDALDDNKTEQSISEKYCKGTLETDTAQMDKRRKNTDLDGEKSVVQTDSSASEGNTEPQNETGKVSIGKDHEVKFTKDDNNDLECQDEETKQEEPCLSESTVVRKEISSPSENIQDTDNNKQEDATKTDENCDANKDNPPSENSSNRVENNDVEKDHEIESSQTENEKS